MSQPRRKKKAAPRPALASRALRGAVRTIWWLGLRVAVVLALALAAGTAWYVHQLPALDDLLDPRDQGSVTLTDADG